MKDALAVSTVVGIGSDGVGCGDVRAASKEGAEVSCEGEEMGAPGLWGFVADWKTSL